MSCKAHRYLDKIAEIVNRSKLEAEKILSAANRKVEEMVISSRLQAETISRRSNSTM